MCAVFNLLPLSSKCSPQFLTLIMKLGPVNISPLPSGMLLTSWGRALKAHCRRNVPVSRVLCF